MKQKRSRHQLGSIWDNKNKKNMLYVCCDTFFSRIVQLLFLIFTELHASFNLLHKL